MKIQYRKHLFAGLIAASAFLCLSAYSETVTFEEEQGGNYTYLNPFAFKPTSADDHWEYVQTLIADKQIKDVRKQLEIFVKRWPQDARLPIAQKAIGDFYNQDGEPLLAFEAYEKVITEYYTGIEGYEDVLEKQLAIAEKEVTRKRMTWLFGGYTAPQRAIPLYESIVKNAPQWDRAAEIQYRIGDAYRLAEEYGSAIQAYSVLEYRYADSDYAEKAAFLKVRCLRAMVRTTPHSLELRQESKQAAAQFKKTYPDSDYFNEVDAFGLALVNSAAQADFEIAQFYDNLPETNQRNAAKLYYNKVIRNFEGSTQAVLAKARLLEMERDARDPRTSGTNALSTADRIEAMTGIPREIAFPDGMSTTSNVPLMIEVGTNSVDMAAPDRLETDPKAVELTADELAYEDNLMIATGNVLFMQTNASLRAERLVINQETGGVIATGNVRMLREDSIWKGDRLAYNFKTKEGNFGESTMYFEPIHITALSMERVSDTEFFMTDALITSCDGDDPSVYAKAETVQILDDKSYEEGGRLIKAKKVTFYIRGVPVFYLPTWQRHLGYRVWTHTFGMGGRVGFFAKNRAALRPTEWLNTNTHIDYYTDRGLGLGQDFFWHQATEADQIEGTPAVTNGVGYVKTYFINDDDPWNSADNSLEEALVDSERYRISMGYNYDISEDTYFATKVNYESDPYFMEDFFREEYREAANPENYAVIQHSEDEYATSARIDKRLNDFYSTVDRLPEFTYDKYRKQMKQSKFYFENESSAGYLESLYGDLDAIDNASTVTNDLGETDYAIGDDVADFSSFRMDTYNKIYMPLKVNDYYNVIPRAAYRGTWYSDSEEGAAFRNIFEFGTLAAAKTRKKLTEKSGYWGDGLNHIIEPYVDYQYRMNTMDVDDVFQFDSIDSYDDENSVSFGVRNFLQTLVNETRVRNVLDADLRTSYRLETQDDEDEFGPLEGDIEIHLTDQFSLYTDFEYDWYDSEFNDYNLRASYSPDELNYYAFSYRYNRDGSTYFTPQMRKKFNEKWSIDMYAQYESTYAEWQERRFLVTHRFDCVSLGTGLRFDEDNEVTFWFQFWLNAMPSAGMGMGQ